MINIVRGINVCFKYTPPAFRKGGFEYTEDYQVRAHKMIFERMQEDGTILIQHNPLTEHDLPNFFRLVIKHEKTYLTDYDYCLSEIDRMGQDMTPEVLDKFKL